VDEGQFTMRRFFYLGAALDAGNGLVPEEGKKNHRQDGYGELEKRCWVLKTDLLVLLGALNRLQ